MSSFFALVQKLFNVIILENQTELFLWLDAIVSTIVMTFRTSVDSHQKKQRFIATLFELFECSSLFTSNSCVFCSTPCNECGRIGTKWLLLFFFYLYWGNVMLWLKRTSTKKLANRISYIIWYKGCIKGKFGRGGPNLRRGVHIRQRIWTGGDVSSYLKYYRLSSEILEYKLILFRSGHFDHDMEKI